MFENNRLIQLAKEAGFTAAAELDCSTITLRTEVRDMCAADKCKAYGKNWTCPPACGTLEECTNRINRYQHGLIVQTVGQLEDEFDFEGMTTLISQHNRQFSCFAETLRAAYPDLLPLGAGGCHICPVCTYPDRSCRFPNQAISSMEAYGMLVSDVCTSNGIPYYYGKGTLVYVGCYLF